MNLDTYLQKHKTTNLNAPQSERKHYKIFARWANVLMPAE